MKLVFKSKDGTVYQISSLFIYSNSQTAAYWKVDGGLQSAFVPEDGDILLSTGMFDKNRLVILVGDNLRSPQEGWNPRKVMFDGYTYYIDRTMEQDVIELTPELAATLEVVE